MLNKQQFKIVAVALKHANSGNNDSAARVISGLYRAARKPSQREALVRLALAYELTSNSHFII